VNEKYPGMEMTLTIECKNCVAVTAAHNTALPPEYNRYWQIGF